MKISVLLFLLVSTLGFAQSNTVIFFKSANNFFNNYVKVGGVVYDDVIQYTSELDHLIRLSNEVNTDAYDDKAFWINVYNLGVIAQVVKHYPIKSPMDISGFFDKNRQKIGGKNLTLNDIENRFLREKYKDPRLHFVLVCGAVGCPPIVNYVYTPEKIEEQLEQQTIAAINNKDFIRQDGDTTKISEIFKWYQQDFGGNTTGILSFINKYKRGEDIKEVNYYAYDWSLNSVVNKTNIETSLSNVQSFTPSKLLAKHQYDVKWFNSVYTEVEQTLGESTSSKKIPRQNFFTSTLEFYYGVSNTSRVNFGFIAQARSNTFGGVQAFSVFNFKDEDDGTSRFGFTTLAPSIRVQPLKSVPNFSFTSSLYLPVFEKNKQGYLDKNSTFWETKFFYDHAFGRNLWQVFTEVDFGFNFGEKGSGEKFANNSLDLPFSVFLSYFPTNKSTVFVNTQQRFLIGYGNEGGFSQNHTAVGFGGKYQLTDGLNLEASYNKFVRGYNFQGLGTSYSLGIRYLSAN